MAKVKNYHIHGTVSDVNRLREEYEFIGKYFVELVEPGHLVIHALPPRKEDKKKSDDKRGRSSNKSGGPSKDNARGNRK